MNRLYLIFISVVFIGSCSSSPETNEESTIETDSSEVEVDTVATESQDNSFENLIPENYSVFDSTKGDLNKDGVSDLILIVKKIDPENIVTDEYLGELDRNRRGLMIFFETEGNQQLVLQNLDCFSSENEDGGVYFPPELTVGIDKGNIYIQYGHGRYGYWHYTFRYSSEIEDFELIGYDATNTFGPIIEHEVSINYLTGKRKDINNINEDTEESGEEVFEETWSEIEVDQLIRLSEVKDFDNLEPY